MFDGNDDAGAWLIAQHEQAGRGQAAWLEALARLDASHAWYDDGQLSCVEWMMWRLKMGRATAFDKLRVARVLRQRPLIAAAFADGRLSYCMVRALVRVEDPEPDVDVALIDLAVAGTVRDVETAVRVYQRYLDQDRPLSDPVTRRHLRVCPNHDGTSEVHITLTDLEIEEFTVTLQAFLDHQDQSSREDSPTDPSRRADAFMNLLRVALAHASGDRPATADRYLIHLITAGDDSAMTLVDGSPLHPAAADQLACDATTVTHCYTPDGEPLALGRRRRTWTQAQRRAALIRDRGHCRFPGCARRVADLHHQQPWHAGGSTDLENGFLACPHHHTLLHRGYEVSGSPNAALTFRRPDGTPIGSTVASRPCSTVLRPHGAPSTVGASARLSTGCRGAGGLSDHSLLMRLSTWPAGGADTLTGVPKS